MNAMGKLSPTLSLRERQCLTYLAMGLRVQELADTLGISPRTAEKQITSARLKLGAATREHAVALAVINRLLIRFPPDSEVETVSG